MFHPATEELNTPGPGGIGKSDSDYREYPHTHIGVHDNERRRIRNFADIGNH
jgi:hypothetical protein